jgi:hypothetical protein
MLADQGKVDGDAIFAVQVMMLTQVLNFTLVYNVIKILVRIVFIISRR